MEEEKDDDKEKENKIKTAISLDKSIFDEINKIVEARKKKGLKSSFSSRANLLLKDALAFRPYKKKIYEMIEGDEEDE